MGREEGNKLEKESLEKRLPAEIRRKQAVAQGRDLRRQMRLAERAQARKQSRFLLSA